MFEWLFGSKKGPTGQNKSALNVRAFDFGRSSRRLAAIPNTTVAINTQIATYGASVIARSRYLAINNPYTTAARESFVAALAGNGIRPLPKLKAAAQKKLLQKLFGRWVKYCDADGLVSFYGMQNLIASELFEAGECFIRKRSRRPIDGLEIPLQLQLIPAEMLPYETISYTSGNRIRMGIEFDAIGRRVAYHFLRDHPGEIGVPQRSIGSHTVRVPAEEVIHIFRPIRAGQIRGIPHTLSALTTIAMLDLYEDAELERKRTAALFTGFIQRPAEEDGDNPLGQAVSGLPYGEPTQYGLLPGALINLGPGETIDFAEPADVGGNFDAFEYRMLLRAAAGFGTTYYNMTGDLRQANYGSLRAGLIEFRNRIEAMQHHVMIHQFCEPVRNQVLDTAAAVGALPWTAAEYLANRDEYTDADWIPPAWDWIDPLKDLQAEALAVEKKFKPRSAVIMESGMDPDEVDEQIAADEARVKALQPEPIEEESTEGGEESTEGEEESTEGEEESTEGEEESTED